MGAGGLSVAVTCQIVTLKRTSGRTSRSRWPPGLMISTDCQSPARDNDTWRTRESIARAKACRQRSGVGPCRQSPWRRPGRDRRRDGDWCRPADRQWCRNGRCEQRGRFRRRDAARHSEICVEWGSAVVSPRMARRPKALVAVERGRAQPAVVEAQDLAAADFQEQLAIIGTGQRLIDDALGPFRCDLALFENRLPVVSDAIPKLPSRATAAM